MPVIGLAYLNIPLLSFIHLDFQVQRIVNDDLFRFKRSHIMLGNMIAVRIVPIENYQANPSSYCLRVYQGESPLIQSKKPP